MMLSIVMASFKRPALLKIGLESISRQNIKYPFEIIVVNDGIEDETEKVCKSFPQLDIKYYFSGKRNTPTILWRCPGFALNIGIQKAQGKYILLTSPEIYYLTPNCLNNMIKSADSHPIHLTIPESGYDDMTGKVTQKILNGDTNTISTNLLNYLNLKLPFCLLLEKIELLMIGGYDEDFIGYCYDDNDIINRLHLNGANQYNIVKNEKILHLFHGSRLHREGLINRAEQMNYNKKILETKQKTVLRNIGREWGVLNNE